MPIPNEHTDRYAAKASERGVYIQTGTFLEVDPPLAGRRLQHHLPDRPGRAPEPVPQGQSRGSPGKCTPARTTCPATTSRCFPVVETEIGRLGAAICYDWLFPEAIRALALAGPRS